MRVAFTTFGCKINQYDTDAMRQDAVGCGGTIVPFDSDADVYVINTCSVTGKADYQCRQAIRAAARQRAGAQVIVTGCYAATRPDEVKQIAGVTHVLGNTDKKYLSRLITRCRPSASPCQTASGQAVDVRTRGFLKIQDGCDSNCSYCIVPQARGGSRSVSPDAVIRAFDASVMAGVPEVVLSGIHIGCYGSDLEPPWNLSTILQKLVERRRNTRIRVSSIEPGEISQDLISLLGNGLCRHLHIPLQSGDDRVLTAMNRTYRAEQYRKLIESVAAQVPHIALGADVMVGFPGESDEEFENTRSLVSALPLTHLHVFSYSPRPGTPAAAMRQQIPEKIKKERNKSLRTVGLEKNFKFRKQMIGQCVEVVIEEFKVGRGYSGLTDNYVRITIESERAGGMMGRVKVMVKEVSEKDTIGIINCK